MRALLDACVIYPTVMREVLLGVAGQGSFTPLWSERILEEWARAARKLGPDGEMQARGEIAVLRARWSEAEIRPRDGDLARLWLPDPNDIHVLAAAIAGSADLIVTLNAKDFPRGTLREEGLERIAPDELLVKIWQDNSPLVEEVVAAVHAQAEQLSGETFTKRALLKRARLPRLGKAVT